MKENKRDLNLIFVSISCFFTIGCVGLLAYILVNSQLNFIYKLEIVADIVASIVAFVYMIQGYSKGAAHDYKAAMIVACINALAVTAVSASEKIDYIPTMMCAIALCLIFILAFGKNLGKKNSLICCIVLIVVRVAGLLSALLTMSDSPIYKESVILMISQISLALMLTMITYAKYVDKSARHSNGE